jgi:DNA-binding LacI/PurR family transcriptional regulator
VAEAIRELNYELKPAYSYKPDKNPKVGLVIPEITNPYFPLLIKGITNIARVHEAEIVLCNADKDLKTEEYYINRLLDEGADGIIYIPFSEPVDPHIVRLIEAGYPLVFLDREIDRNDICSVTSDNEEGAFQAITYLLNLGHRDILYIAGPPHFSTTVSRTAGYRRGLAEMGVPYREESVLHGDTTFENAYQEISSRLKAKARLTAVFASNDLMALGAWRAVEEQGLKVPDDVSIVGYDDIPCASIASLTTIAQPSYETGRNALLLLMDLIKGRRKPPQRILLRDSLIIRKSCGKI